MNHEEFACWQAVTASSTGRWVEDAVTSQNGKGNLFYIGGEEGVYMRIYPDGRLSVGTYEYAFPHIGEAVFTAKVERHFANVEEAFQTAVQLGGKKFMTDLLSSNRIHPPVQQNLKAKHGANRKQPER